MSAVEMLSGLHAPNQAFSTDDYRVIGLAGNGTVKLLVIEGCEHTVADLLTLRSRGVKDFTVRLRDTRAHRTGIYPKADDYVEAILPTISAFYALGVRRFQLDNEPNVEGMWDHRGYGPDNYQYFIRHVLRLLRPRIPADVILVSPPLSYSPGLWRHDPPGTPWEQRVNKTDFILDQWIAAYHFTDGGNQPSLWQIFDEVGANVYWESERQMIDPSFGAAHEQLHARSGRMKVCVLEFANSASRARDEHGQPVYTMSEVHEMRRAQYPEWLRGCRELGYVTRTYVYISPSATSDWWDYRLTDAEAVAIGAEQLYTGGTPSAAGRRREGEPGGRNLV